MASATDVVEECWAGWAIVQAQWGICALGDGVDVFCECQKSQTGSLEPLVCLKSQIRDHTLCI